METKELINVLECHRNVTEVTIPKSKDCTDFWNELATNLYYNLPRELQIDLPVESGKYGGCSFNYALCKVMRSFADNDSLEILNKKGRILKRFAKHWKDETGIKLSDSLQGVIGDKIQYFLNKSVNTFYADFTDVIDWNDGQFGKGDSCWWGCYSDSRPTHTKNGGWAIRFYDELPEYDAYEHGIGRTWIIPRDGMLFCYNSYGVSRSDTSKTIKEIFNGHGIELHYKVAELTNQRNREIPYINGGTGFILFPSDIDASDVPSEYDFHFTVYRSTKCVYCGNLIDTENDDYQEYNDDYYCQPCADRMLTSCNKCGDTLHVNYTVQICDSDGEYSTLCSNCLQSEHFRECYFCDGFSQHIQETADGYKYCPNCTHRVSTCEHCQNVYYRRHECPQSYDLTGLAVNDGIYTIPDVPGIHFCKRPHESEWSIIHTISDLRICGVFPTFNQTRQAFIRMSRLECDWTRNADVISQDNRTLTQINRIYQDVQ